MKKVIVVLNDLRAYDQFLALPPVFTVGRTDYHLIRISDEPHTRDVSRIGQDLEFAHDLRFVYEWNKPQLPFYDYHTATVNIHRLPKEEQMERLTRIASKMNLTHFHDLGFSVVDFSDLKIRHRVDPSWDKYVLKPTGGARSMGVFFIDKPINFKSFIGEVATLRNGDTGTKNEDYINLCDKFGVRFNVGTENRKNEAAKVVADYTLLIQEMNPFDDVQEFRALVGAEQPLLVRRTHFDDPKDKSVVDEVITEEKATKYFSEELYNEIIHFLENSNLLPHGSIDIWYSRENDRWGIYEYQCQFAHVYIPEPTLTDYLKDVIVYQHHIVTENAQ